MSSNANARFTRVGCFPAKGLVGRDMRQEVK